MDSPFYQFHHNVILFTTGVRLRTLPIFYMISFTDSAKKIFTLTHKLPILNHAPISTPHLKLRSHLESANARHHVSGHTHVNEAKNDR